METDHAHDDTIKKDRISIVIPPTTSEISNNKQAEGISPRPSFLCTNIRPFSEKSHPNHTIQQDPAYNSAENSPSPCTSRQKAVTLRQETKKVAKPETTNNTMLNLKIVKIMRCQTTLQLQYAHRFYGYKGEAQYLHGHTGVLTIEVEEPINENVNMVYPCHEIQRIAWSVLQNFDHAIILRRDDPLLPAILEVYEKTGIRYGSIHNRAKGPRIKNELCESYPDCRLVVTRETPTAEGIVKIAYELLKNKLNIVRITFDSGESVASQDYQRQLTREQCPHCGVALDDEGACPRCGYQKVEKTKNSTRVQINEFFF